MAKSVEESFVDWESHVFGHGYGTGEEHTLGAIKTFMETVGDDPEQPNSYDYQKLEAALTPAVAWLLINTLCRTDIIEYGTSPRFAWLTREGVALKEFLATRTVERLVELCCADENHDYCWPSGCNCGPHGYEQDRKCLNPFWVCR